MEDLILGFVTLAVSSFILSYFTHPGVILACLLSLPLLGI
jgi:hypothetical protein